MGQHQPTPEGLVPSPALESERVDQTDDRPAVGTWWWVTARSEYQSAADYDRPGRQWLACVVEVGSNYVKVEGARLQQRIGLDGFHLACKPEPQPQTSMILLWWGLDAWYTEFPDEWTDFARRYVQPLRIGDAAKGHEDSASLVRCLDFLHRHSNWALSRPDHKTWGVP